MRKQQVFNPYLPSWEYVPDGEPHVFGDRVYVYGSHDFYNGYVFCMGDYVCWSAPVNNLTEWRYEGVIYKKNADPLNQDETMCLYAPDVTKGADGKYYLYYVLDKVSIVSVAVCDKPAGKYTFLGYVHDKKGKRLGERPDDQPQFDPAVITENEKTYLYTGFCGMGDKSRKGAMVTVLGPDMMTITEETKIIVPGCEYSKGSGFEGHDFFEGPSIRKIKDTYYFVYSSIKMHELCYATSKSPDRDFIYRGVLVSNSDLYIDSYKPASQPMAYGANNHGGMVDINGNLYIFYHRHTNGTWFSRQGCAEKLTMLPDGSITQAELTSCGLNDKDLVGEGYYPAYIACNLFNEISTVYVGNTLEPGCETGIYPKIMQDGCDGMQSLGYIGNMRNHATAGFKYFDCENIREITIIVRGYAKGCFEVRTTWDGEVLAKIPVAYTNVWTRYSAALFIPNGKQAIYLTYTGDGNASLLGFELKK